jgi:hypothetical protein
MRMLPLTFSLFVLLYLEICFCVCHITLIHIIYHGLPLYEIWSITYSYCPGYVPSKLFYTMPSYRKI